MRRRLTRLAGPLALLALLLAACSAEPDFVREADGWRYRGLPIDVDSDSFRPLGRHYGRDARQVVYVDTYRDSSDFFSTRRLRLLRLTQADPVTFTVLDDDHARDTRQVYDEGRPFPVRHVGSFEVLVSGFARDRETGYYRHAPVRGSDGNSFRVIGEAHAQDATQVWWCGRASSPQADSQVDPHADPRVDRAGSPPAGPPAAQCTVLPGARPGGVELLERGYARTRQAVYFEGRLVAGAEPGSFEVNPRWSDPTDARDSRRGYSQGRASGAPYAAAL